MPYNLILFYILNLFVRRHSFCLHIRASHTGSYTNCRRSIYSTLIVACMKIWYFFLSWSNTRWRKAARSANDDGEKEWSISSSLKAKRKKMVEKFNWIRLTSIEQIEFAYTRMPRGELRSRNEWVASSASVTASVLFDSKYETKTYFIVHSFVLLYFFSSSAWKKSQDFFPICSHWMSCGRRRKVFAVVTSSDSAKHTRYLNFRTAEVRKISSKYQQMRCFSHDSFLTSSLIVVEMIDCGGSGGELRHNSQRP